ncbi:chorismate mutase [Nonomuraea dietziae]|uniref:Chorismate mutase n=1 Tax=Nonomuraea dietziae TaxID=65515 RepID=A0A7W5VCB4_9ACTN|nr:chorismate mutase [Nonomuraea dietziae]MBB3732236.1 chorismate mutase [Nonomuraea dietziae]
MTSTLEPRTVTRWVSLRPHHGRVPAEDLVDGPLYVEPFSAADLPAIAERAAGVVVGSAWMQDFQLVRAVARLGLPVIVQRGHSATLEEWLGIADYCVAEGNDQVVLCESGTRTHLSHVALDLTLLRAAKARSGRPVLADVSGDPSLAPAAIAAGADGLLLSPSASDAEVAVAREAVALFGALAVRESPSTLPEAREAIDRVDAALAVLLERRAELAGVVQSLKPVGGFAGRDMERERQLVAAMAERAPKLGAERLAPIMNAVIEAGLRLAEER